MVQFEWCRDVLNVNGALYAVPVSIPIIMIATKVARQTAYSVPIILAAAMTSHSHIRSVEIRTSIDPKNICRWEVR